MADEMPDDDWKPPSLTVGEHINGFTITDVGMTRLRTGERHFCVWAVNSAGHVVGNAVRLRVSRDPLLAFNPKWTAHAMLRTWLEEGPTLRTPPPTRCRHFAERA